MATIITTSRLEDLLNEILLEIFDYLDANDLCFAFASLNSRISLILYSTHLHVNIHFTHRRHQVEFFVNHLKSHPDQVVSLQIYDKISDQQNVISFLFGQCDFLNLHSCIFHSIHSSSKLKTIFENLSKLTKIVLFRINQLCEIEEDKLDIFDAHQFSQFILMGASQTLPSINDLNAVANVFR